MHSHIYGVYGNNYPISTIFIGGGTPSILDSKYITRILDTIKEYFTIKADAEISIETNPGTFSLEKAVGYINAGINRISIGLQTANEDELRAIGRIHSYKDFINSYNYALESGFKNINVDLMSALPYQTLDSYKETLNKVLSLSTTHISAYSLILEEGTPLYDYINNTDKSILPDEDTEREMYYLTKELLLKYGYNRYEISNYAKAGYECKHNLSYWSDVSYLGIGVGASSYIKANMTDELASSCRYQNIADIHKYIDTLSSIKSDDILTTTKEKVMATLSNIICDRVELTNKDSIEEYMYLGLRKVNGISICEFKNKFNTDVFDIYKDVLDKYKTLDLLTITEDTISLTDKGLDVSNTIFSDFLLD
jgi:oxygen-independent coproporphyrinogen-3 oxidase